MEHENGVTVNFFEGRQKKLWIVSLVLSLVLAIVGWLLWGVLSVNMEFAVRLIFLIVAVAGTGTFLICIVTMKMRTSKWVADGEGVTYFAFGRKLMTLTWSEMKEVGYLKITDPRRHVTAYYLYWTTEELMSACRGFIKGGVMEHKPRNLGRYNCRKGSIILYSLDPNDPVNDPLLLFTQKNYIHQIKNPKVLQWAAEAAQTPQE